MPTRFELANAIRALSMDAVQKANSGHPGMPMGMADIAEVLWNDFLRHNPGNPGWADRDRFVLSNGHGSMLVYSLLHLAGYDLPMEQLQNFRQLHSKTPGHPEYGITAGIETTTGPLGQGLANGVGMALAEKILAGTFNREGFEIVDHFTYVFAGDGCLMEGISHEVCSLAGTLGLGKLVVFYDDNGISIDGHVEGWFTDDTPKRFEAYGWQVIPDVDGHDPQSIYDAIQAAQGDRSRPTLICCKTIIGFGSPAKAGTHDVHGAPLGEKEIAAVREKLGWSHPPFAIPQAIYEAWDARERGHRAETEWKERFARYAQAYPALAADFQRRMTGDLPESWQTLAEGVIRSFQEKGATVASRKASQMALEALGPHLPELLGGSADLTGSNLTMWSGSRAVRREAPAGNYIYYGVREFGMSAMINGIALHGGLIPYGGTFLVFSDYARNALRLAGLMQTRSIFVYTHDSIGLGEDGPTHQPIEHLASLDLIPNLRVWRPCDTVETAVAWKLAIETNGPSALALSRQNLPHQPRDPDQVHAIQRGGYILRDSLGKPDLIFLATGSEIGLCTQAADQLSLAGFKIRVVSVPCLTLFEAQDPAWRDSVLPPDIQTRIAVEVASPERWRRLVGLQGRILGIQRFGESAPGDTLMRFFGFTPKHLVEAALTLLRS